MSSKDAAKLDTLMGDLHVRDSDHQIIIGLDFGTTVSSGIL
jgi:hypothetical protein